MAKVKLAAQQIEATFQVQAQVTAPGNFDSAAETPVKFDRLGLHRRVLAFIEPTAETPAGKRDTLAGLAYDLMKDPHTTHPPATHGRLEVVDKSVEEVVQQVADCLDDLIREGLVADDDGVYSVTKAGTEELSV